MKNYFFTFYYRSTLSSMALNSRAHGWLLVPNFSTELTCLQRLILCACRLLILNSLRVERKATFMNGACYPTPMTICKEQRTDRHTHTHTQAHSVLCI